MKKKTIEDCHRLAERKEGKCLSTKYTNSKDKYIWMCKLGHQFLMGHDKVNLGAWCQRCAGNKRGSVQDCNDFAKTKSGQFLSDKYTNCEEKYLWRCSGGHEFYATCGSVFAGSWCAICAGIVKKTIQDCHEIAQKKKGLFLANEYGGNKIKYKWQCELGHKFLMSYHSVDGGAWCPKCSILRRSNTIDDCHKLAKKFNGIFLSDSYTHSSSEYEWQCKNEHKFYRSYNRIRDGRWCPICQIWKNQKLLKDIVSKLLNNETILQNFRGFAWLKTDEYHKQELDIWVPSIKLAIEYDGQQHFKALDCFGGNDGFLKTQQLDALKNQKIAAHPEDVHYFIRFNYKETITEDHVKNKLIEHCVPIPTIP